MVKLTLDLISRCTSGYTKKKRDESVQHYLKRLTHLYLENRSIDEVGEDISSCRNLAVLYLYDNKLQRIPNLLSNGNLTHLYLQNNGISKVEYLNGLRKLEKLYLGGNCITVVEGLDKLENLQELHIENQRLSPGEKILFDPRTLVALSRCVQILNVSGNGLDSIRDLEVLTLLTQFMACDNNLNDMKEVVHCLSAWRYLWRLELNGNPLCHKAKYKDRLIIMAPSLGMLDGKEITATARQFLKNWQANKEAVKKKRELISRQTENSVFQGLGDENGDLPPIGSAIAMKQISSVPGYIMPGLQRKQFQDVLAKSASQPGTAVPGPRSGHLGYRTFSEMNSSQSPAQERRSAPPQRHDRYVNPYSAVYHIYQPLKRPSKGGFNLVNIGSEFSTGDMGNFS